MSRAPSPRAVQQVPMWEVPMDKDFPELAVEGGSNMDCPGSFDIGSVEGQSISKDSHKLRQNINQKKREFFHTKSVLDLGNQDQTCGCCEAQVWSAEFTGKPLNYLNYQHLAGEFPGIF